MVEYKKTRQTEKKESARLGIKKMEDDLLFSVLDTVQLHTFSSTVTDG